jgi:predicted MPP superfamily phosphohydrolase
VFNGSVQLRSHDLPIAHLPGDADGLRIAHVSDLHLRSLDGPAWAAQSLLLKQDYHLLVCTGDIACVGQSLDKAADLCRRFFEPLAERTRCLAVLGNHDAEALADVPGLPVRFLCDEWVPVRVGRSSLAVAGVNQAGGRPGMLERALDWVGPDQVVLLLAHYPSTVYRAQDPRIRAVLAGHTHGGQIRLPLLGCLWAQDQIPLGLVRGLHTVQGRCLHVSAGLGVSTPLRFRFLCPPEMSILTLRRVGKPDEGCSDLQRIDADEVGVPQTSIV